MDLRWKSVSGRRAIIAKVVNIIVVPQEHDTANHLGLWEQVAAQTADPTVVVNIGADLLVSIVKRRFYRLREAIQKPARKVGSYCLLRPLFAIRPEVAGDLVNRLNMALLIRQIKKLVPDIKSRRVRVLVYSGLWADLFRRAIPHAAIGYYVLDEVTRTASTGLLHPRRTTLDRTGCMTSDAVFLMSPALVGPRIEFEDKLKVIGNGAEYPNVAVQDSELGKGNRQRRHVGLVGNIRDWIDTSLLRELVAARPDLEFGLLGNVEANMTEFVSTLVSDHSNVTYYGKVPKHEVASWYRQFDVVIVPYLRNTFMSAARPIKIVEAVFAGVPVVSIPVSGYSETSFIRFAESCEEFSAAINQVPSINYDDPSYEYFLEQNSWRRVARDIIERLDTGGR